MGVLLQPPSIYVQQGPSGPVDQHDFPVPEPHRAAMLRHHSHTAAALDQEQSRPAPVSVSGFVARQMAPRHLVAVQLAGAPAYPLRWDRSYRRRRPEPGLAVIRAVMDHPYCHHRRTTARVCVCGKVSLPRPRRKYPDRWCPLDCFFVRRLD